MNTSSLKGLVLATAAAGMFLVAGCSTTSDAQTAQIACQGINGCKGQGACKSASNECKGKNACKGTGFSVMSKAECDAAKAKL